MSIGTLRGPSDDRGIGREDGQSSDSSSLLTRSHWQGPLDRTPAQYTPTTSNGPTPRTQESLQLADQDELLVLPFCHLRPRSPSLPPLHPCAVDRKSVGQWALQPRPSSFQGQLMVRSLRRPHRGVEVRVGSPTVLRDPPVEIRRERTLSPPSVRDTCGPVRRLCPSPDLLEAHPLSRGLS